MEIYAENYSDFVNQFTNLQSSVSERGMGRTTEQTEGWVIKRLLPSLVKINLINFPLSLIHQDRPDLLVKTPLCSIGIELTEVVPPMYAQATAIRNHHYPDATVDRSTFSWGAQFSTKEIHNYFTKIGNKLTDLGWTGDSVEQEWSTAVNESISKKTEKLNKKGFTLLQYNWLAVYTSSPGPMLDINHACPFLKTPETMLGSSKFDIVFVLTSNKLVVLNNTGFQIEDQIVT